MPTEPRAHREILAAIDRLRAEHHACTAAAIGLITHRHKSGVNKELWRMKKAGLVSFTKMPGSVRRLHPDDPAPITDAETEATDAQLAAALGMHVMRTDDDREIQCICSFGRNHGPDDFDNGPVVPSAPVATPPAKSTAAKSTKSAAKTGMKPRSPAQIAATERMRAAQAAKRA